MLNFIGRYIPFIPLPTKAQLKIFSAFSLLAGLFLSVGLLAAIGTCDDLGYYYQAAKGHLEIIDKREPLNGAMLNPKQPESHRAKLRAIHSILSFAQNTLTLPTTGHYENYADIGRKYVTWNVFAAHEFSFQLHYWCYIIIGCQPYRAYFSPDDAIKAAKGLQEAGYDVFIAPADTYSTRGYFEDSVLNTFVARSIPWIAEIIFHELSHLHTYVENDTGFNESFAIATATLATLQWLKTQGLEQPMATYTTYQRQLFAKESQYETLKRELNRIYAESSESKRIRQQKTDLLQAFIHNQGFYGSSADLPEIIQPYQTLNNAFIALHSTSSHHTRSFYRLFTVHNCQWKPYLAEIKKLSQRNKSQRDKTLDRYRPLVIHPESDCLPFASVLN